MVHRVATSNYKSSLHEMQTQWSLIDLIDATEVCDIYDTLQAPEIEIEE